METHGENSLTMAGEDYLEAIYRIMWEANDFEHGVRSVDVADDLKVSKASVNKALSYLKESAMVEQARYGRVTLTAKGAEYARDVWRRHRALRKFLVEAVGVAADVAEEEACLMEHDLSAHTMSLLYAYMERNGVQVDE